jgi:hypothetical protein
MNKYFIFLNILKFFNINFYFFFKNDILYRKLKMCLVQKTDLIIDLQLIIEREMMNLRHTFKKGIRA